MLVVGEKINASNRSVAEAIARWDSEFVANLARAQVDAGAHYIEVNAGVGKASGHNEMDAIAWQVEVVQAVTDKPLAIDSESPNVIEAALRKYRGEELMINSVTAEQ